MFTSIEGEETKPVEILKESLNPKIELCYCGDPNCEGSYDPDDWDWENALTIDPADNN